MNDLRLFEKKATETTPYALAIIDVGAPFKRGVITDGKMDEIHNTYLSKEEAQKFLNEYKSLGFVELKG